MYLFIYLTEPNAFDPVIKARRHNKRGIAVFKGEISEDEKEVKLTYPLQAYDNDKVGGASKCSYCSPEIFNYVHVYTGIGLERVPTLSKVEKCYKNIPQKCKYVFSLISLLNATAWLPLLP